MTNAKFADTNVLFKCACLLANIPPTKRQASRWLNNRGKANKFRHEATKKVNERTKE